MSVDADELLRERARGGLACVHGSYDDGAWERLEQELSLIRSEGSALCWLAVGQTIWNLKRFVTRVLPNGTLVVGPSFDVAKRKRRELGVGPGWGPNVSSVVSYALQVTEVDPILHGLLFEEFYSTPTSVGRTIWIDLEPDACVEFARELSRKWVRLGGAGVPVWEGSPGAPSTVRLLDPRLEGGGFSVCITGNDLLRDVVPGAFFQLQWGDDDSSMLDEFGGTFGDAETVGARKQAVFEAISRGGPFPFPPFDTDQMARYCRAMQPSTLNDLAILIALVTSNGAGADRVFAGKYGPDRLACPHPVTEPILAETYGALLFSEQAIRILAEAGDMQILEAAWMWRGVELALARQESLVAWRTDFGSCAQFAGFTGNPWALFDWLAARGPSTTSKAQCMAQAIWAFTAAARAMNKSR